MLPEACIFMSKVTVFTVQTDPKPVNNLFILFQALKQKKNSRKKLTRALL